MITKYDNLLKEYIREWKETPEEFRKEYEKAKRKMWERGEEVIVKSYEDLKKFADFLNKRLGVEVITCEDKFKTCTIRLVNYVDGYDNGVAIYFLRTGYNLDNYFMVEKGYGVVGKGFAILGKYDARLSNIRYGRFNSKFEKGAIRLGKTSYAVIESNYDFVFKERRNGFVEFKPFSECLIKFSDDGIVEIDCRSMGSEDIEKIYYEAIKNAKKDWLKDWLVKEVDEILEKYEKLQECEMKWRL